MKPGLFVLICAVLAGAPQAAQERDAEAYAKVLERTERVARLQVPRVVAALKIEPGMHVVDLGAGSGLFTLPMARVVAAGGVVYAVDVDSGLIAIIANAAREEGLDTIRTALATPDDPRIPEAVDLILICDTLHHIANPGPYLKRLRGAVKPGGRIAIIDYRESWPPAHESMRYTEAQLDRWMSEGGFRRVETNDFLDGLFFIIYR